MFSVVTVRASDENMVSFFFKGAWYCFESLIYDIFHWSEPKSLDAYKTIPELIMTAGYRFETHKIVTQDNYINTAWRIVGRLNETNDIPPEKKPCVILQHGLLDNSATWLILNSSQALPFMLVNEGYDVWMTNSRGNINSFEHMHPETHNVKVISSEYYQFTWDEMAKYDLPANLNYVLSHSTFKKAFYVGHSQGTTQFFAAAGVIPELGDKIAGFVGVGPVMYVGNMYSPYLRILMASGILETLDFFKIYNFLLLPNEFSPLIRYVAMRLRHFLWRVIGLIWGIDKVIRVDLERMGVMGNHEPGGTGLMNTNFRLFIHNLIINKYYKL